MSPRVQSREPPRPVCSPKRVVLLPAETGTGGGAGPLDTAFFRRLSWRPEGPSSAPPDGRMLLEVLRVAVHRDHAEQVSAGGAESVTALPVADLDGAEAGESRDLCRDVVGLDVEVVAGLVVDSLNCQDVTGQAVLEV